MARKKQKVAKINHRKLKAIGFLDCILTICTVCLVFFMVIESLNQSKDHHSVENYKYDENRATNSTELAIVEIPRKNRGNLGFYSGTVFLVLIGLYEMIAGAMLIHASFSENRERKKQFPLVEYWVDNACEVLIIMSMAWLYLLGESLVDSKCKTVFTNLATQITYLVFYLIKIVFFGLVFTEHCKYTAEDKGLKPTTRNIWLNALRYPRDDEDEDVESGIPEGVPVSGANCMTGGTGRRNRLRDRRERLKKTKVRQRVV